MFVCVQGVGYRGCGSSAHSLLSSGELGAVQGNQTHEASRSKFFCLILHLHFVFMPFMFYIKYFELSVLFRCLIWRHSPWLELNWGMRKGQIKKEADLGHRGMQKDYLVPAVSQVNAEDTHAMEDKLHGGQEIIQHGRLQKVTKGCQAKVMDRQHKAGQKPDITPKTVRQKESRVIILGVTREGRLILLPCAVNTSKRSHWFQRVLMLYEWNGSHCMTDV